MLKTSSISVIIPVHDGESFLAEAIGSVLSQTRRPNELIVIDDGSTDRSREVARSFPEAIVIWQERRGAAAARNAGLARARSDLVAFLDADDLWVPAKLEAQVAALAGPHELIFGWTREFSDGEPGSPSPRPPRPAHLPGCLLAHRSAFEIVGPFDESLRTGEFVDWYARAAALGYTTKTVRDITLLRRLHVGNAGTALRESAGDYARILKRTLDRRRASANGG